MRKLVAVGFVAMVVVACSGGAAAVVGASCSNNNQCTSLSSGYCAAARVCTRPCSVHSDCGCAPNTTNGDISQGACQAACIDFGAAGSFCTRVCANNAGCEGTTTCNPAVGGGANLGYSVCD